jgi:hypothetical protein
MRNVVRALIAAACFALGVTACDNGDLPPASQYSAFKGTVVDAATKQPIAGAIVIVDSVLTTTTDANGSFTIAKVPSGIVDYVVRAKGYADVIASANADPGKPLELNVALALPTSP